MKNPRAFFVGIKGVAMTALAVYLKEKGWDVVGSDVSEVFQTDQVLREHQIEVRNGFDPKDVDLQSDVVIVTGAHGGMNNPQAQYAKKNGLKTVMHGEYLGSCMREFVGISVAGCHGKTTTTAYIATMMMLAGLDPSYAVGAAGIRPIGEPGHFGRGKWFIAEADEYVTCPQTDATPRFLWHHPYIAVITNIDYDHPDVYSTFDQVQDAYRSFIRLIPSSGTLILCADDPTLISVSKDAKCSIVTYGFHSTSMYRISDLKYEEGKTTFSILHEGNNLAMCSLRVPGAHNASNALAACIAVHSVGIPWKNIPGLCEQYKGASRRFEYVGIYGGILLYDDYAHHPKEIIATIKAAASWYPHRRIVVFFQPHTFSRTKQLMKEFAASLSEANAVFIADIFPSARESFDPDITSNMIVEEANKQGFHQYVSGDIASLCSQIGNYVKKGDVVITMGAGDISSCHSHLQEVFLHVK